MFFFLENKSKPSSSTITILRVSNPETPASKQQPITSLATSQSISEQLPAASEPISEQLTVTSEPISVLPVSRSSVSNQLLFDHTISAISTNEETNYFDDSIIYDEIEPLPEPLSE